MTTVVLIDDHELIRQGLRRAFERSPDFEVVGEASTAAEAVPLVGQSKPNVVVVDIRLPDGNGLDLVRKMRAQDDSLGIVVLTMYGEDDHLFAALDAGASAFVAKDSPASDVVSAAGHAAASPRSFSAADLADAMRRRANPTGPQLSGREREVLGLLAEGHSVASISRRLYISESTTKTHISKLYDKLEVGNRASAVMAAIRLGLVKGQPD